ncbi:uncharacterized protein [Solanum lycopersicum]|uniref:uncharacterized protein n=1 Tax=Solanum lycopersicum TaxID=4081 RepID=UPI0037486822
MNNFLYEVSNLVKTECTNAMLLGDMNISRLMTHAQQLEGDKLREQAKDNKKARTAPAPSSASVPSSKNRFDQKVRAPAYKSQGSVSGIKTYPTCSKCGKNHPSECIVGKEGCSGCSQFDHRLMDCPSRHGQAGGYDKDQFTTSSAPTSLPIQ